MKRFILNLFAISLLSMNLLIAQNPFKKLGVDVGVITLSKGKYIEFIPYDSIQHIGSVVINIKTGHIIELINTDSIELGYNYRPDVASRWMCPDPLAEEYWDWSPYNYCANNPIKFVDPDGRIIGVYDENGNYYTYNYENRSFVNDKGDAYKEGSKFMDNVLESFNYILDNDADVAGIIEFVAGREEIVNISEDKYNAGFDPDNNSIAWDPYDANMVKNNSTGEEGIQTPALGLFHEIGHAYDKLSDPDKFAKESDIKTHSDEELKQLGWDGTRYSYSDLEEKRVIENYETKAAMKLRLSGHNEGIRDNHDGGSLPFNQRTAGPTTTKTKKQLKKGK